MSYLTTAYKNSAGTKARLKKHRRNPIIDANFTTEHLLSSIRLPNNIADIPHIVGWSGPARTGTSALLFLLAGHPDIDRVYFQPQKTIMRFGQPSLEIYGHDQLICMKEVFYSRDITDPHDPVETLLRAGIPEEKITWIAMLRDPLQTYASWGRNGTPWTPDIFSFWQDHTIKLWNKYKDSKVNAIPFVYELLQGHEEEVVKKLLSKMGVDVSLELEFNRDKIDAKLVPGEAKDGIYFVETIEKTIDQGNYVYTTNDYPISDEDAKEIIRLCQNGYDMFYELARLDFEIG